MGATHFVTMVAATYWGILTSRFSPKLLYLRGMVGNVILFLCHGVHVEPTGLAGAQNPPGSHERHFHHRSHHDLLLLIPRASLRDLGLLQTSMTLGQLVVLPSALCSFRLRLRGAFVSASAALLTMAVFCFFNVRDVPAKPAR